MLKALVRCFRSRTQSPDASYDSSRSARRDEGRIQRRKGRTKLTSPILWKFVQNEFAYRLTAVSPQLKRNSGQTKFIPSQAASTCIQKLSNPLAEIGRGQYSVVHDSERFKPTDGAYFVQSINSTRRSRSYRCNCTDRQPKDRSSLPRQTHSKQMAIFQRVGPPHTLVEAPLLVMHNCRKPRPEFLCTRPVAPSQS